MTGREIEIDSHSFWMCRLDDLFHVKVDMVISRLIHGITSLFPP